MKQKDGDIEYPKSETKKETGLESELVSIRWILKGKSVWFVKTATCHLPD